MLEHLPPFERMVVRYLAAGDAAYTSEGLTLDDMFKRLNGRELLMDFAKWADLQNANIEGNIEGN